MKKLVLATGIIALLAIGNNASAQGTRIGAKGGVSFTGVSNLKGKERLTGHGGLYLQTPINTKWAFQPELLYSAQGQHFTNDQNQRKVLALDYVQLPLMFHYHPAPKFFIEVGPQVGYLINSQVKDASSGSNKVDVKDNYKKTDVGLNAGLGFTLTNRLGIYGRYSQGLMDVVKSDDIYRTNNAVQLGATIKF
jgi:hypothetical protein